jgi:hypothetical protein
MSRKTLAQRGDQHQGRIVGMHQASGHVGEFVDAIGVVDTEHGQDDDSQGNRPGRSRERDPVAGPPSRRFHPRRAVHHRCAFPHALAV